MKKIKKPSPLTLLVLLAVLIYTGTGCRKMFGLELQTDTEHVTSVIDPRINKSAWQFLQERSYMRQPDTIFKRMYDGLIYAGIDTAEYTRSGRTFIFLNNDAIYRFASGRVQADCFFGRYLVAGKAATKWSDYPKDFVKNYFLYLIAQGEYTFDNLTPDNKELGTLMPKNVEPLNPESILALRVVNDRFSKMRVNDYPGTVAYTTQRFSEILTGGIISNNGPIHVANRVVEYRIK
jgi:hypothetical protein